ncbi:MAG: ribonuclease E/G, partial [Marinicaulis sp.]|nr:ribonuclease E/G [Marinicaulis sp.]
VNEIIVDQGAAATEIRQQLNVEIIHDNQNLFEKFGAEAALEEASNREILLPGGGGGVVIDEAEALTAIDVDVRQAGGPSDAALNKRINLAAARAIGQALALRNIGGQIAVDFLPAPESVRNELTSILKKHAPEIQKAHWTKSGLFTFIRPRIEASLLERATERVPGDPFGARQFTLDWQAKTAISRMESALRASPTANVEISAGEGLFAHFAKNAQWRDRIVERYGARLSFAKNDKLTERDFAIDQQR